MVFPATGVKTFIDKVDFEDYVLAAHVNTLQSEMTATQTAIGASILTADYGSTSWAAPTGPYSSLSARLENIEHGLINGVPSSPYLAKTGGSITPAAGNIGVTITSANTNTSDLIQAKDSSAVTKFKVDYAGIPYVGSKAIVYVDSTEYTDIYNAIAAVEAAIPAGTINPLLLAGM